MNAVRVVKPQPGDAMPAFFGIAADGRVHSSEDQAGRAAVLILIGAHYAGDARGLASAFGSRLGAFAAGSCDIVLLRPGDASRDDPDPAEIRVLKDLSDVAARCGVAPDAAAVILVDRSQRVALRLAVGEERDPVEACLEGLARLPVEAPQTVILPAPVLVLPNLLPPAVCRDLIALFERSPSVEGRMASVDADGVAVNRTDTSKKSRRDLVIEDDDPVWGWVREAVFLRCRAEIARAFQSRITCADRLVIARYDASGGWFRRHRDNLNEDVAFREFAISLNLNDGDYDGGCLSFPEYNDHLYRPQAGAGIVFSASILHEATAVTRGSRYVLLTFFHGDAAEEARLQREQRLMQDGED